MSDQTGSDGEQPAETVPELLERLELLVLAQEAKIRELEEAVVNASRNGSGLRHVIRYDDGVVGKIRTRLSR